MDSPAVKNKLKIAILLSSLVLCAEIAGGIFANSLALLSDAAHMFLDVFTLCLTFFAIKISEQPSTHTKTFGYHRIEIFAAFINGTLLILMAGGILYEAYHRFSEPQPVQSSTVVLVATLGLMTNLVVMYILRKSKSSHGDLNVKSALYHVLGDTLASLGVIIGGIVMWYTQWYVMDAIISAGISLIIFWGAKRIVTEAVHILLEGVPRDISITEVEKELTTLAAVQEVHELHIWSICSNIYALSTHALVNVENVNQTESLLEEIKGILRDKFNITHSTIQLEANSCGEKNMLCDIKH